MRSASARGYGVAHQRERERLRPYVERGDGWCNEDVCLFEEEGGSRIIYWPEQAWDLAHTDDRTGYKGEAHARCNRADGARRGNRMRRPRRLVL